MERTFERAPFPSLALPGLLFVGTLWTSYAMRSVLIPLTFALLVFLLLRPLVRQLARWHVPRLIGSALVLGFAIAAVAFVVLELAGPATVWARRMPDALHQLEAKSRAPRHALELALGAFQAIAKTAEDAGVDDVLRVAVVDRGWLRGLVEVALTLTSQLLLTVVAAFFLLMEGDILLGRLSRITSVASGGRGSTLTVNELGSRMSRYLLTVTLINIALGAVLTGALFLLGIPHPWLWGGLAAVLNYVPYLGPAVGVGLVAMVSLVTFPAGMAFAPPLAYFVLSVTEGNVVTPLVLGRAIRVSPLVVFVWLALWVWLWSVPGAILACPLLVLLKIVCDESPSGAAIAYLIRK